MKNAVQDRLRLIAMQREATRLRFRAQNLNALRVELAEEIRELAERIDEREALDHAYRRDALVHSAAQAVELIDGDELERDAQADYGAQR